MLKGHGNDGRSGLEGARSGNVIGTYLHGPLLPKNVWFADWLIATALGSRPASSSRSTTLWSAQARIATRGRSRSLEACSAHRERLGATQATANRA